MATFIDDIVVQIKDIYSRIRQLELATFIYGAQPDTPPPTLAITTNTPTVTYYVEPSTGTPRASVAWSWQAPTGTQEDPVVDYLVSITRATDSTTGLYSSVGNVTTTTTSGHPVNTNLTFRIYAVTQNGVNGPVTTQSLTITQNLTPPPQPSTPSIVPSIKGVRVYNDGKDSSGNAMPVDFAYYELHMHTNTSDTFTPSSATLYSIMGLNESQFIPGNDNFDTIYVRLITVNKSGNKSPASTGVHATPTKAVQTDMNVVLPGNIGFTDTDNLVIDGSFENPVVREARQGLLPTGFSFDNTAGIPITGDYALKIGPITGSPVFYFNALGNRNFEAIPVVAGNKYLVSIMVRGISSNGTLTLNVRYTDQSNTITTAVIATENTWSGGYEVIQGIAVVPSNVKYMESFIQVTGNTTGAIYVDSVIIKSVVTSIIIDDAAITNAKIADLAVSAAKIESVDAASITVGQLQGSQIASNTITTDNIVIGAITYDRLDPATGTNLNISSNPSVVDKATVTSLNNLQDTVTAVNGDVTTLKNSVRIDSNGININKQGSPFQVTIDNDSLDFLEGQTIVAYVSGQKMYIKSAEITNQLTVGVHVIEKYDNNNTFIRKIG